MAARRRAGRRRAGFAGIALMDHLIQIPQVGRAWEPIPEPWVTLGLLGRPRHRARARHAGHPGDLPAGGHHREGRGDPRRAVSGGRAFVGVGAGWWEREHAAFGLPFPPAGSGSTSSRTPSRPCGRCGPPAPRRTTASGSPCRRRRPTRGRSARCRSSSAAPATRTLRIAARLGDAVNVPSTRRRSTSTWHAAPPLAGTDVAITVLDLPVVGRDRDDTWARVERLRGRTAAAAYAARTNAGTVADQRDRYAALADRGVSTVFVALADLDGADDLDRPGAADELSPVTSARRSTRCRSHRRATQADAVLAPTADLRARSGSGCRGRHRPWVRFPG